MNSAVKSLLLCVLPLLGSFAALAQALAPAMPDARPANMGTGPGAYPMHYGPVPAEEIKAVLDHIHAYLEGATPDRLVDRNTNATISDFSQPNPNATVPRSTFQLVSYEWGVTYAGMLRAAETTGDKRFADYTAKRFKLIADIAPMYAAQATAAPAAPPGPPAGPGAVAAPG